MGSRTGRKGPDPQPLASRFWAKVQITDPPDHLPNAGPCLMWTGATQRGGYGKFSLGRDLGTVIAHRMAWLLLEGEWPEQPLDHLCRRTACVAPLHLDPVTTAENNARAGAAKTHCLAGHLFDEANTYVRADGSRQCRACARERQAAYDRTDEGRRKHRDRERARYRRIRSLTPTP